MRQGDRGAWSVRRGSAGGAAVTELLDGAGGRSVFQPIVELSTAG